jgi:pilus assembly protein Flp/PilA
VIRHLATSEEGVTAIEYALIAGLIAVAIVTAVAAIGSKVSSSLDKAGKVFP